MPLRLDLVPIVRTLIQLLARVESQRNSCGKSLTVLTTTSMSPSLSKSPNAAPREALGSEMPGPAWKEMSAKWPLCRLLIEQLALRIAGFGAQLLDFGINVAVADEDVGPTVVIHVEKSATPAEKLGVRAESGSESGVLETGSAEIVVERRRVAGKICFDDVEVAVEIVVGR